MHACMNRFVTSLKKKYINRQFGEDEQWLPVRGDGQLRRLFKLQLVETDKIKGFGNKGNRSSGNGKQPEDDKDDKEKGQLLQDDKEKRKSILHTDLFKTSSDNKPVRKIVVKGNAGIGKTTLCTMLTEEWAKGNILKQFDCVLLLPLRENRVSSATSLPELIKLFHPDEETCIPPTKRMKGKEGEGVLIIADGWDELSEGARATGSFLYELLLGYGCSKASVLLTSRHSATEPFHTLSSVDAFIEVVGFDEENIKQYIVEDFKDDPEKASSLMEQLKSNPLIQSLCSVPLNCAIVCDLWHNLQQTLPSTITKLYARITLSVVLRDIKKKCPQLCVNSLDNFNCIPKELQNDFWLVCKFAFEFLAKDQIVFSDSEVSSFSQDGNFNKKAFFFGLLQSAHSHFPSQQNSLTTGYGLSFHFAHLTIQEFLAALHIVTLSQKEKTKICNTYAGNNRFNMVWRFVFGLKSKEVKYRDQVVSLGDTLVDQVLFAIRDQDILLCHCSLESQDKVVHCKVANRICAKFSYCYRSIRRPQTAHDSVALLHIFNCISHCSEVKLDFSGSLNDEQLQKLATILIDRKLQVKELSLDNCKLTGECLETFFNKASASFRYLYKVSLDGNFIKALPFSSSNNTLTSVSLSKNPLWQNGVQSLESVVRASSLVKLEYLCLSSALTNDTDIINTTMLVTLLPALATHCPNLKDLNLSKNNIGVPGAGAIGEALVRLATNRKELELNLSETNLNSEAAKELSDKVLASLEDVSNPLSCEINLCVDNNPLGHSGLLAIFRMLSNENCPVTGLDLDDTHAVKQGLITAISIGTLTLPGQCSKVKNLYFQNNKPSGNTHVACLTMAIKANIFGNLERMQLSNTLPDNVEENGRLLTELLPSIASHCPHLEDLDLSENNIGVPGASAIGEAFVQLATNRKKLELNLSETNLDSEAAKAFSDKVLASLEEISNPLSCKIELSIYNNPLGHSGLLAIFRMLSNENCPVKGLDLDDTHAVKQGLITAISIGTLTLPGQCSKVKNLYFQNNKPSGNTHLAYLTMAIKANIFGNLEWLRLSNTLPDNVEENGRLLTDLLPSIASHCPHLNDLDISENNIGVPGAGAIGEIFVRLATNRKDLELNLSETNLNSEAAKEFSDKVLASLEDVSNPLSCEIKLRVDNNPLGHSGLLAIFRMLSNENCPVTGLDLDDTHAVKQGLITAISIGTLTLPGQCSKVKNLYFQNNKPSGNTHVACLTMAIKANIFGNLERMQLSNTLPDNVEENGRLLTELLPSIASHCPHLKDLDLSENNLGVPGASAIAETFVRFATNRKELELKLSETNLDSEAAKALSDKVLDSLEDVSNPLSCEIKLRVDNNPLGHSGLLAIFRMLSNENCPVTRLDLDHTHAVNQGLITATDFGEIETPTFRGRCSKLKRLSFQNNKPSGDTHVACLTMAIKANIFGNLERMQLSNTLPDNVEENGRLLTELLPSIASHCPNLNDLDLSENNLGVPGASAIGEAFVRLATNRKELELNLSETNLDSEAAKELSDKILASLEDVSNRLSCEINLCVDNNPLGHSGLSAIFRMLSNENCPITRLDLDGTHTVNQGLITATELTFPGQCSKLKSLSFQNNKPSGNTHVACLIMAIKANIFGNLERMQLSNTLPDNVEENGRLLTDLLPSIASHCPHLEDLDLSKNNIGVPGAVAIGEVFVRLATNRKELELNLSETNLDSEAAKELSDKILASLEDVSNRLSCEINLCVDNNPLGHSGLSAIFRMLSNENCPITRLHLESTIHTSITDLSLNNPVLNSESLNSNTISIGLRQNLLHGKNIFILAECIQCCQSLEKLDCIIVTP